MQAGSAQERSLIIVGAGMAGLSAGCYARMNGFRTQIFEMNDTPGGLCTSWQRDGYTINGCVHWLFGSAPGSPLYRVWEELGAVQGHPMFYADEFMRIEGLGGRTLVAYTDPDRLQQEMLALGPEDERLIRRWIRALRASMRFWMPLKPPELVGRMEKLWWLARSLRSMLGLGEWVRLSVGDVAARFKNPYLREGFLRMGIWPPEFSALFHLINLGKICAKQAGYPVGGSLALARTIEARYRELGGEIRYGARVEKILVEQGRAVGIRLAGGEEQRADAVISAADGHRTLFELLEGRYLDDELRGYYQQLPVVPALVHVAFGIRRRFPDVPPSVMGLSIPLSEPLRIAGQEHPRLLVSLLQQDPTLAPAGGTVLKVLIHSDYAWWAALSQEPERYAAEKERIADQILAALEKRFPGLSTQVEVRDVATPVTFERYTSNWKGAYQGWLPTPAAMRMRMRQTLPGLEAFYMAGQWVSPGGGLPSAALSGRQAIQLLCARNGRHFVTARPGEQPRRVAGKVRARGLGRPTEAASR